MFLRTKNRAINLDNINSIYYEAKGVWCTTINGTDYNIAYGVTNEEGQKIIDEIIKKSKKPVLNLTEGG